MDLRTASISVSDRLLQAQNADWHRRYGTPVHIVTIDQLLLANQLRRSRARLAAHMLAWALICCGMGALIAAVAL